MKFDITQRMHVVDDAIDRCANPFHKAILENYRRHANLEVSGMWEQILVPEMTSPDAVYHINVWDKLYTARGTKEVSAIYRMMAETESTVIHHTDETVMVSDQGMMSEYIGHRFWKGHHLQAQGVAVEDPSKLYIVSQRTMTFFPYNSDAILTGETVYFGADMDVRMCPPEEFITLEELREKILPKMKTIEEIRYRRPNS